MSVVEIINRSKHNLPEYATPNSAGLDLHANIDKDVVLKPMQRKLIPTGLFMALPEGTEAQIRPRSGLAYREGITVLNAPGTIDADYRGEVMVLLINLSDSAATIQDGDRIAQMVIAKYEKTIIKEVEVLSDTSRGEGGFGSTGKSARKE
jgi:dUTP pyrophosphatase